MGKKIPISWFGLALIIIGAALLLDRLNVVEIHFSTVFWPIVMVLGLMSVGRGFGQNRRGKIFWGSVWFLYGLFFFLRSSDFVELRGHMFVPATFLIIGIAFLMMYFNNLKDWFFLLSSLIFIGIGMAYICAELDYLSYWDLHDALRVYWPVILILFGLTFIFRRRHRDHSENIAS